MMESHYIISCTRCNELNYLSVDGKLLAGSLVKCRVCDEWIISNREYTEEVDELPPMPIVHPCMVDKIKEFDEEYQFIHIGPIEIEIPMFCGRPMRNDEILELEQYE